MSQFLVLLGKELRTEARSREFLSMGALLVLLILLLANLAWGGLAPGRDLAAGVLWIALVFAGTLGLARSVHRERDQGTWDALAVLPIDWGLIFLAKAAAHLLLLLVLAAIALPLYALLFDTALGAHWPALAATLLLATLGLSAAGTLLALVSAHARGREVLLPLLLFPLLVPLLMVALQATARALAGEGVAAILVELEYLAAYDTIFLALGWLTADYLLGD